VGTDLKENKEVEERIGSNLRRLMSLGRAAGVTVQLATQKPSSDIVPTALRDMVISRVAYACTTDAQTDTILGAGSCHAGGHVSTSSRVVAEASLTHRPSRVRPRRG
jgi:DNA segregation ATPase FtsK/SpoIIIE-like protein